MGARMENRKRIFDIKVPNSGHELQKQSKRSREIQGHAKYFMRTSWCLSTFSQEKDTYFFMMSVLNEAGSAEILSISRNSNQYGRSD